MMFEYIQSLYSWKNFKKHNKLHSLIYNIKDNLIYKKLLRDITSKKSNYDLLLDVSNLFSLLNRIYGNNVMMKILEPYVSYYGTAPYNDTTRHSLAVNIDDDAYSYFMEITYDTIKNPLLHSGETVEGYYVVITNKRSKISNGYSLYSNTAYKFPELDNLINTTIRISLRYIISAVRKYILDNHKVTLEEDKYHDFFPKRNI